MNSVSSGGDSIPDKSMVAIYTPTATIKDSMNKDKSITILAVCSFSIQEEGRLLVRVDDKSRSVAAYVSFDMLFEAIDTIIKMSIKGEYTCVSKKVAETLNYDYEDPFAEDHKIETEKVEIETKPASIKRRFVRRKE